MQMIVVVAMVLLGAFGTVLMKVGAEKVVYDGGFAALTKSVLTNPSLLGGILMQLIPLASWVVLLKFMPLTKLQPMIALTYVVTPALAVLFLGEQIGFLRGVGIALIVLGVMLVGAS